MNICSHVLTFYNPFDSHFVILTYLNHAVKPGNNKTRRSLTINKNDISIGCK